ncbi:MAG: molecular chaperone TorD family protein [Candidatus Methanoperedens sp.]|nr:molecular chaperone TorD family protein [Candidatus Methanoperedens sp.]
MIDEVFKARATFYGFLSRMFVEEPPYELAEDIVSGKFQFPRSSSFNRDFSDGLSLFEKFAEGNKDAGEIHEKLCREFTRLFVGPVPAMFPYESKYIDGSMMAKSLLKVKEEYRKAQLLRVQDFHEPEDHIAMELGFMSNLCRNGAKDSLRMQNDFLKDHLSKWAPVFCDELCEKSSNDFYRGIGKITKGFLISEKELLDELHEGKGYIIKNQRDN